MTAELYDPYISIGCQQLDYCSNRSSSSEKYLIPTFSKNSSKVVSYYFLNCIVNCGSVTAFKIVVPITVINEQLYYYDTCSGWH